jgi:hypothetical protein
MNKGLKFQRQRAAYVATGGTARYVETVRNGIVIDGGRRYSSR